MFEKEFVIAQHNKLVTILKMEKKLKWCFWLKKL